MAPSKYKIKNGYITLLLIAITLFLVEVVGWNLVGYSRYRDALPGADPISQVKLIVTHPLQFTGVILRDIWSHSAGYLRHWAAIYGLNYWPVPVWTYYLYGAGLLTALLIRENGVMPNRTVRIGLSITFIAAYIWTIASLYISHTPVGTDIVLGVQ